MSTKSFYQNSKQGIAAPTANTVDKADPINFDEIKARLQRNWKDFVFRRVKVVNKYEFQRVIYSTAPDVRVERTRDAEGNIPTFQKKEFDQYVEEHYAKFYSFTTNRSLRKNDEYNFQQIYFNQSTFVEVGVETIITGELPEPKGTTVPPRRGDLICGIPEIVNLKGGKKGVSFKKWFIASEQFLRLFTHICFEDVPKMSSEKLMSGNRLATNNYLKWFKSYEDNNVSIDENEKLKRFWMLRTEKVSRDWIHVYNALYMMSFLKVLPNMYNVPKVKAGTPDKMVPQMRFWSIPPSFVSDLIEHLEITERYQDFEEEMYNFEMKSFDVDESYITNIPMECNHGDRILIRSERGPIFTAELGKHLQVTTTGGNNEDLSQVFQCTVSHMSHVANKDRATAIFPGTHYFSIVTNSLTKEHTLAYCGDFYSIGIFKY